jgi:hypothetical protein
MAPTNLIQHSFELAAARCEDLTPPVYRRLFREHAEAESLFRREACDLVKGSMLALTVDAMPDWSLEIGDAWRKLLDEIDRVSAQREA